MTALFHRWRVRRSRYQRAVTAVQALTPTQCLEHGPFARGWAAGYNECLRRVKDTLTDSMQEGRTP
jgi:hypothetical protein